VLRRLVQERFTVDVVVTRPDKRRARSGPLSPSPVKVAAAELGLAVAASPADLVGAGVELGVVVAYGALIGRPVLEAVPMVNVHFSLLPRWRGAAPVERALLAGDRVTGVCLMAVEEGLDTGPLYGCREVTIDPDDTASSLRRRLTQVGADLLVEHLAGGLGAARPQEGQAIYAAKVTPDELRLDWKRPAAELARVVRVGRAWTTWRGRRLLVVAARPWPEGGLGAGVLEGVTVGTGDGALVLERVQPEGRAVMDADEWARGARPGAGELLGG
jgi:methionyl-tRNA formyltransferase